MKILIRVSLNENNDISLDTFDRKLSSTAIIELRNYFIDWFDLSTPLDLFYAEVGEEKIFKQLIQNFYGLRLIKVPDLFEAICWSIIGQQINLRFAYQMKYNLVRNYGEYLNFEEKRYYVFPSANTLSKLDEASFRSLQFSRQKIAYIKGIAEKFVSGEICKEKLSELSPNELKDELIKIKGIGNWSANYIMLRCLGIKEAFPIEDAGLHQALRNQLKLKNKPSIHEVRHLSSTWKTWKGYRTYYLWHSLLNDINK